MNHQFAAMLNGSGLYYRNRRILSKLKDMSDAELHKLIAKLNKINPDSGVRLRTQLLALNEQNERIWQQKRREGINPYQPTL